MVKTEDWRAAYQDVVARGRARAGDPPTPEELVAWSRGELPESEAARIRELLALYPDLAQALAEDDDDDVAPVLTRAELDGDWKLLQERMNEPVTDRPAPSVAPVQIPPPQSFPWQWATAASLLLACALGGLFVHSRSTVDALQEEMSRPRANIERLVLLESAARGSAAATPVRLQPATEHVILALAVDENVRAGRLDVAIRDAGDRGQPVVWRGSVHRAGDGTYSIEVPRSFLTSQAYTIELYEDSGTRPLARYTLWLAP